MRLKSLTVENCKSYRERERIEFDPLFTILIGPNAGGKSNTLDILNVFLRTWLLHSFELQSGEEQGRHWRRIRQRNPFEPIAENLDAHEDCPGEPVFVEVELEVGDSDLKNMERIREHRRELEASLAGFRDAPFPDLQVCEGWEPELYAQDRQLCFSATSGRFDAPADQRHQVFQQYLNRIQALMILSTDIGGVDLRPPVTYFSPYRGVRTSDLHATLANEDFFRLLHEYVNATSRTPRSLIKLASVFFAERLRALEPTRVRAKEAWKRDPDVRLVTRYLKSLGYRWTMELIDRNQNRYQVVLRHGGRSFSVEQASSGEKEMLNFLLGLGALRSRGGLVLIDEPELHLHPRWQVALRGLLSELAEDINAQIVVSTHSPVFVRPSTIGNVVRIAQDADSTTRAYSLDDEDLVDERTLLRMINSQNNERMLFADRVILVEGPKDRLIVRAMTESLGRAAGNDATVEVIEVLGKSNFASYRALLESLGVETSIIVVSTFFCKKVLSPSVEMV